MGTDALARMERAGRPQSIAAAAPAAVHRQAAAGFHARITPNKALSAEGCLKLIIAIGVVTLALQIGFIAAGAWPAAIFLALDALLLIAALVTAQSRLDRQEDVAVADGFVIVRRFEKRVLASEVEVACFGLAVEVRKDPDFGLQSIHLRNRQTRIEIARDLSPPERHSFLDALCAALASDGARPRLEITHLPRHPV